MLRALILALVPLPAMAQCPGATFLSCPVGGNDWLEVCINADHFTYAFGPQGAPELALMAPMAGGPVAPWPGVGSAIWSSVTFPNGGYGYEVWSSVDRNPDAPNPQGGVNVLQGEALLSQLTCLPGSVDTPAFVLEDAMHEAGYCWNLDQRVWQTGGCG